MCVALILCESYYCLYLRTNEPQPSIVRLGVLLLLFDVYLTWARIERQSNPDDTTAASSAYSDPAPALAPASPDAGPPSFALSIVALLASSLASSSSSTAATSILSFSTSSLPHSAASAQTPPPPSTLSVFSSFNPLSSASSAASSFLQNPADIAASAADIGRLSQQPIVYQYVFFLVLCALSTVAFHVSIRFLTSSPLSPLAQLGLMPAFQRPNSVSTALLVSSSTKLFPILMVIWDYDVPAAARSLGWAVVVNNIEALKILLDCGYGVAAFLAMAGALSRWAIGRLVLWVAGLGDLDGAGANSVAEDGRALWAVVLMVKNWAGRLAVG